MVATRRLPACSDSENWLSSVPCTSPLARYSVAVAEETSNLWIAVDPAASGRGWVGTRWLARYSPVGEA